MMNTEFKFLIIDNIEEQTFIKLTLSDKQKKDQEVNKVLIKLVQIKKGLQLSFVYRYDTKDVTKNYLINEGIKHIEELLENDFKQAMLFTSEEEIHYNTNGKSKLTIKKLAQVKAADLSHDKTKKRLIETKNNVYLKELGVCTADGKVKKDMQDKYKQINKYIEIVADILAERKQTEPLKVVDMGAGKGYLTFALYDYLIKNINVDSQVFGVELRPNLVKDCNAIAEKANFQNLKFIEGRIESVELPKFDMLVALHACDTATDDAIYRGIISGAELIICSPCCHKQVRRDMNKTNELGSITRFGILQERQAELFTDAIRALYLEAYGYKTHVFEFIATEHTPKNNIITAIKTKEVTAPDEAKLKEISKLKALIGLENHYLDTLNWK